MAFEIVESGTFLESDADGYLLSDSSVSKIRSPWSQAVEYARRIEVERLGAQLHSLYLRGSAARGTALEGRSDLDMFAVLYDDEGDPPQPWSEPQREEFHRLFPFVAGLEISNIRMSEVRGPFHYYRFMMKISAVCIHGEDLLPSIAPYRTDAPIAEEWFRIFPHLVDLFVRQAGSTADEERARRLCEDMMKGFLRAGMLLVMRRHRAYTRDLYPSYTSFSACYPDQDATMRRCLELAVNPTADLTAVVPFATDFGAWMRVASEAEFGPLELLPASLVR